MSDASIKRGNHLYALPAAKLSPFAEVLRDELKRLLRQLVDEDRWQGVTLALAPVPGIASTPPQEPVLTA